MKPRPALAAVTALALALSVASCAPWRVRATRATGLCPQSAIAIERGRGDDSAWFARCEGYDEQYFCRRRGTRVECNYVPQCSRDGIRDHHEGWFLW